MLANYALSLYRTLSRRWLYALINVTGLALGIAVCTTLFLVVRFETSFDRWIPGAENVYRVDGLHHWPGQAPRETPDTQGLLLANLQAEFPQIRAGARLFPKSAIITRNGQPGLEQVVLADPSMFRVFALPFAAGDATTALADPASLVISQSMARKYFGTDRVVGRGLAVTLDGAARNYRISGVLRDLPPNTHLMLDFIIRLTPEALPQHAEQLTRWGSSELFTYIQLRSPANARTVAAGLSAFVDRRVGGDVPSPAGRYMGFVLRPLLGLNFTDAHTSDAFKTGADPLFVGALGIMGAVVLLIAVVNYISLATAHAGMRAREVAMRKVVGATRGLLVSQFVMEAIAVSLAAGLIAAALVELGAPLVSLILGETIAVRYFGPDGLATPLLGLTLLVGLVSGVYPALVLSNFRAAAVLASARAPGGGRSGARVREALALGQFAAAICLMICTTVIFVQMRYLHEADIGFRRDGLIIVQMGDAQVAKDKRALLQVFRGLPGVISATASTRRPATDQTSSTNIKVVGASTAEPSLMTETVAPDYAKTYGISMVAGRALGSDLRMDDVGTAASSDDLTDRGLNVMINQSAVVPLGFRGPREALGHRLRVGISDNGHEVIATIVGVAADVRFKSPRAAPMGQFYLENSHLAPGSGESAWAAALRVRQGDEKVVLREVAEVWRRMEPATPLQAGTAPEALEPYYDADARRGQLFAAGAVLSAAIACLGLYGLAAFNTSRRVKEIGIRKTLGASTADVLRLLVGEFLRPVLWANLIAWPVAYFAMRWWLAGFDQRISLNPAFFLIPSLAALAVAVLTVAEQAIRVSRAEPSRALRYE
jgi:putative ABC transport system permease protein